MLTRRAIGFPTPSPFLAEERLLKLGEGRHRRLQRVGGLLRTDPAEPVIATYWRIFPGLFKPFEAMPADLQKHVRYPGDLFLIQAQMYGAYHMDAPEVFNREDLAIPPSAHRRLRRRCRRRR